MDNLHSTADTGKLLGLEEWQVRRLFEDGTISEPPRFAGKRIISKALLRRIHEAAIKRGWLQPEQAGPPIHHELADRPVPRGRPGRNRKPAA